MNLSARLARNLREIHFGNNWTWSYLEEHLEGMDWVTATTQVPGCNTIALLVFHMNYYLNAVADRVAGRPSQAKHELSLVTPPIGSSADWEQLLAKTWTDAENFAQLVERLPESRLWEDISEKYGSIYRNIQGVIEHNHYHLGQIVILKKIIALNNQAGD